MQLDFSDKIHQVLKNSREEALRLRNDFISTEHLLLGLLKGSERTVVHEILKNLHCDIDEMKKRVEKIIQPLPYAVTLEDVPLTKRAENVLRRAWVEAERYNSQNIKIEHLFLALIAEKHGVAASVLDSFNITYTNVSQEIERISTTSETSKRNVITDLKKLKLSKYGQNVTELALKGQIDPVIGREEEIERVIQILMRRKKNNPVLIGEPGVGKTAVVEGLALRVTEKRVPPVFHDLQIFSLDLGLILAGTQFRGQFEERFKEIVDELEEYDNIVLFIDELHTIIGAGGVGGNLDVSNLLKPALASGKVSCIGATTLNEYQKYIEHDKALERRFQRVMVEPPSNATTYEILQGIKAKYESYHHVHYTEKAILESVRLADRYITDKFFPDKAIDLLDEAGAMVSLSQDNDSVALTNEPHAFLLDPESETFFRRMESLNETENRDATRMTGVKVAPRTDVRTAKKSPEVTSMDIAKTVRLMTGIPMTRLTQTESDRLISLEQRLNTTIVGQTEAIEKITKAIKRARTGLKDPRRPVGSFVFIGPSAVGKTKLAQELATNLFDKSDALVQLDMSEYMEKFAISRLIGAPPGYVGHEEGGQLTEAVRRHPYSVILLDQIDKAHPEALNILLQILDDGMATDSMGRKVDFRNTLIIMTVNHTMSVGQSTQFGFNHSNDEQANILADEQHEKFLRKLFPPEFLNRIDDIIPFHPLNKNHFMTILEQEINRLLSKTNEMNITVTLTDSAREFLSEREFNTLQGARSIRRIVQQYFENPMAEKILKKDIVSGDHLYVQVQDGRLSFTKTL